MKAKKHNTSVYNNTTTPKKTDMQVFVRLLNNKFRRMKSTCLFFMVLMFCFLFAECSSRSESYLNGNIYIVDDINITDSVVGEKLDFDGAYFGMMKVCDSEMIFFHPRFPNFHYSCFNVKTGKHTANFFPTGAGPNEFNSVTPIIQTYKEEDNIKSFFVAINEEKAGVFNITKSIKEKTTVLDTVFELKWRDKSLRPFIFVFFEDDTNVLAKQSAARIAQKEHSYSLPRYLRINYKSNEIERQYDIFTNSITNKKAEDLNRDFFQTYDLIKPDKSKIAMGMSMLAQINILDVETGELKGFRISGTPDFDYLTGSVDKIKNFYHQMAVDDNYIYLVYVDKKYIDIRESVDANIVHVFDWHGNFCRKIFLDNPTDIIEIDSENRILYGFNLSREEIFQYKLSF